MKDTEIPYHIPVLLEESVSELMFGNASGIYCDMTFGGGGHSREILKRLDEKGRLLSFDQDPDVTGHLPEDERFTFELSNFKYLRNWLNYHEIEQVDGILADLGVSSHHFDAEQRGFSFRFDAPLDMRMNQNAQKTAADLCNDYDVEKLTALFKLYGELKNGYRLAQAIVAKRSESPITTTGDLVEVVSPFLPKNREKKELAKVFQALRIEVNQEMEALEELLVASMDSLKKGGRLVIITYHSLEDRMVKNFMRAGRLDGEVEVDFYGRRLSPLRPVYSKVILPSAEEQALNPRSRSAKLRVAEKVDITS